jgi:hypothetical protein
MPKIDIYKKIFICHYGKVASNTLAQSLADALKKRRTSIKTESRYYNEYILTTGLTNAPLINEYLYSTSSANHKDATKNKGSLSTVVDSYSYNGNQSELQVSEHKIMTDNTDQGTGWISWTRLHPRLSRNLCQKTVNVEEPNPMAMAAPVVTNTDLSEEKDEKDGDDKRILVICVCRNLITRLVSMYFQIHEKDVATKTSEEIISKLDLRYKSFFKLDSFPSDLVNNLDLGFDLYKELARKPIDSKYFLRIGPKVDFLLLKFENINDWPAVFKKVFGIPNFKFADRNLSSEKNYYELYQKVLATVKQNPKIIKHYHKTQHFQVLGL